MATLTASDVEPCFERFGPEDTSAARLRPDESRSPELYVPTVADAILSVTAKCEAA